MQQREPEQKPPKPKLSVIRNILRLTWRGRSHDEAVEQLLKLVKNVGVPEEHMPSVRELLKGFFTAWRGARRDDEAFHRIDRYLVGGIGAIDLILLTVVIPMGTPDLSLIVALLALIILFPLAAGSLFFSFLKQGYGIKTYGRIHSNLSGLSLLTGTIALIALFWHISLLYGIVFLLLAVGVYILCFFYATIILLRKHFPQKPENQAPATEVSSSALTEPLSGDAAANKGDH